MKIRLVSVLKLTCLFTFQMSLYFSSTAIAAVDPDARAFTFKYRLKGQTLEVSQRAPSYEVAYEKAAQACFKHYKSGRVVGEEEGLDIIDVCANPKS